MSAKSNRDPSGAQLRLARFPDSNRRRFLMFGAGSASVAAAAPVLAGPAAIVALTDAQPQSKGYQETEHVRDYYATTRI